MNALDLALRAQARDERATPIDSTEAVDEARREARANASVREQAAALLRWAAANGHAEHPRAVALRETRDPDDLVDAIVKFYFELPGSTNVAAARGH